MYLEIMGSDNWFTLAFFASAFLGAFLGTIFICDYIGTLIGMFLGIIVLGGVTNPIMVKQAECLAQLPYQQENCDY